MLSTNTFLWRLGFFNCELGEAVGVKMPPACYRTLLKKIHTIYYKALQCEMSPTSFTSFYFDCQNTSLCGALRGCCCAVMANRLNSLFRVDDKRPGVCGKWFKITVLISIPSLWSVCNLTSKQTNPQRTWNTKIHRLKTSLEDFGRRPVLHIISFSFIIKIEHLIKTENFIKSWWKMPSVLRSEISFVL